MVEPSAPLQQREWTVEDPGAAEVVVKIAGCGVCHTDLGFLYGGVRTKKPPPLTLGHEIAGTVAAAGGEAKLESGRQLEPGMELIIPAVLPCGECSRCRAGRENICARQLMPGNDLDGGFATHIIVPARYLVPVETLPAGNQLRDLAVVADAVTTPYQAMVRGRVQAGDPVVVIGAGGIGIYGIQVAAALGASVIAVDIDPGRVETSRSHGAAAAVCTAGLDDKAARDAVRGAAKEAGWEREGWKVFEMSGTAGGQRLGFSLLTFTGTLGIVGFTLDRVEVRLSNFMAFDADAFGSWACRPAHYPKVLDLIGAGKVQVKPFVTFRPLAAVNEVLETAHKGELSARAVLVPED
jgi:6-hydroxycyclohex-1-ene-1-carbonyl-CoA dehydrogenase